MPAVVFSDIIFSINIIYKLKIYIIIKPFGKFRAMYDSLEKKKELVNHYPLAT